MEYFDNNEQVQSRKYAFKCHRRSEAGRDLVYPVNAIAFHPSFGTFATGGRHRIAQAWNDSHEMGYRAQASMVFGLCSAVVRNDHALPDRWLHLLFMSERSSQNLLIGTHVQGYA